MLRRTRSHARTTVESVDLTTRLNFYLQYTTRMHVALTWAGGADVAARRRERMSSACRISRYRFCPLVYLLVTCVAYMYRCTALRARRHLLSW
jgi:hypothetical protein